MWSKYFFGIFVIVQVRLLRSRCNSQLSYPQQSSNLHCHRKSVILALNLIVEFHNEIKYAWFFRVISLWDESNKESALFSLTWLHVRAKKIFLLGLLSSAWVHKYTWLALMTTGNVCFMRCQSWIITDTNGSNARTWRAPCNKKELLIIKRTRWPSD